MKFTLENQLSKLALKNTTLTAGGTVTATGESIDRFGTAGNGITYNANDIAFLLGLDGAVANTKTLSLKAYLRTSDVSNFASDVSYVAADGTLKTSTTGAAYAEYAFEGATAVAVAFDDILDLKANLAGCKRYVQLYVDATFSNTGTDNVIIIASAILSDSQNNGLDTLDVLGVVNK